MSGYYTRQHSLSRIHFLCLMMKGSRFLFMTFIYTPPARPLILLAPQHYWLKDHIPFSVYQCLWSKSAFHMILLVPSNLLINLRICLLVFTKAITSTNKHSNGILIKLFTESIPTWEELRFILH